MGGREEPPEGAPEGVPGGDDEFRSVVFDESFVRAARIRELSARERLGFTDRRPSGRGPRSAALLPRQAFALMLLIAVAFAAAVYMGVRHPYRQPERSRTLLTTTVVPLAPRSAPRAAGGSTTDGPFARFDRRTDGAGFADGMVGLTLPAPTATKRFPEEQVTRALAAVQQFLFASSLDSKVLVEGGTGAVRDLLVPAQRAQFDDSVGNPRDDLHHAATGWMVRFDPAQVTLAVSKVKVTGTMSFRDADDDTLEVLTDHTFVYALQAAPRTGPSSPADGTAASVPGPAGPTVLGPTASGSPASGSPASGSAVPGPALPGSAAAPAAPGGTATALPGGTAPGQGPSAAGSPASGSPSATPTTAFDPDQLSVPGAPVTLFTVRRELRFRFDRDDIAASQVRLVDSVVQAGPMACDADTSRYLRPVLAGQPAAGAVAGPAAGIDPLDRLHRPAWQVCGVLGGPMADLAAAG
ncbi:hypothetical protein LO771_09980 [Streptacidiphilus sp. ASG 303]|uniref:SCO2583 family membrane protein n=1 Tax=Streptacidiphilus sp. ASG 303 TaxID=2896847 RepID=UPI001E53D168|nr:hypothetical protein [Streptacidiphilus sp. ASG 303]MCD0482719.1 hypothetical protein [Streptacidiphilus sp. ASG 303]